MKKQDTNLRLVLNKKKEEFETYAPSILSSSFYQWFQDVVTSDATFAFPKTLLCVRFFLQWDFNSLNVILTHKKIWWLVTVCFLITLMNHFVFNGDTGFYRLAHMENPKRFLKADSMVKCLHKFLQHSQRLYFRLPPFGKFKFQKP